MPGPLTLTAESDTGPQDGQAERAGRIRRAGLLAAGRRVLIAVVLAAVGYAVASEWTTVSGTVRALSLGSLLLSGAALIAGLLVGTVGWQLVLDGLGPPIGLRRAGQILLVGSLGKYVPGSVWAYVLQMELGRKAGVQRSRILTASIVQTAVSVVGALLLGIVALPLVLKQNPAAGWLYCLLPVGLSVLYPPVLSRLVDRGLRLLRRPGLEQPIGYAVVGKTLLCSLLSYGLFGVHLWLLAATWSRAGASGVLLCTGAIAVAMTVSLFAFILPSGVGLREAVLAAVLSSVMPPARAVAVALVSRLFFTVGDVASAGLAALGVRLSGRSAGRRAQRDAAWPATRIFLAALAVYFALSAAWSVCMPLGTSPDEPSHLVKAAATARGEINGVSGFLTQQTAQGPTSQPARFYRVPEAYVRMTDCYVAPAPTRACYDPVRHGDASGVAPTTAGHYNPIYYAAVGWPSLIFPGAHGMYLVRLMSALLNSLLLAGAFTIAARTRRPAFALAGLVAATTPMVLYLNGVVNPNGIEASSAVLAWTAALALATQPDRALFRGRALGLGVALAVLANARPLGFEWIAAILAVSAVVARRDALAAIARDRFAWLVGGCITGPLLFGLWWTLAHGDDAKVPFAPGNAFWPAARTTFGLTQGYIDTMIGVFGWLDTYAPAVTYQLWSGVIVTLMILACALGRRREAAAVLGVLLGVVFVPVLAQALQAKNIGMVWQGRYLLAFAVGLPLLCGMTAAVRASAVSRRTQLRIVAFLMPALAFADFAAFFHTLRRYMVGLNGKLLLHPITWEPPGTWIMWLPIYAIALIILVILVTRASSAADTGAEDDSAPQDDLPGLGLGAFDSGLDLSGHARMLTQRTDFAAVRQAPVS